MPRTTTADESESHDVTEAVDKQRAFACVYRQGSDHETIRTRRSREMKGAFNLQAVTVDVDVDVDLYEWIGMCMHEEKKQSKGSRG